MVTAVRRARKVYSMLGSPEVWETARRCHDVLSSAGLPHVLIGGIAVCLYGYQRKTVGVDLLVRAEDAASVKRSLQQEGFDWDPKEREFRGLGNVPIHVLVSRESASDDRSFDVRLPDPEVEGVATTIEGLPVIALPRLIELKIACGLGNMRRTHRDFADVVELILVHKLSRQFARHLHKAVQPAFRALVLNARGGRQREVLFQNFVST